MFGISISGAAGAGKDFVASHLVKTEGFVKLSFAEPLKRAVAFIVGCPPSEVDRIKEGRDGPEAAARMRALLQTVGLGARQAWGENVWVDNLMARVAQLGPNARIVITDTRFRNEFDALKAAGFTMARVDAPVEFHRVAGTAAQHPSERDLDSYANRFDHIIFNDHTKGAAELAAPLMRGHPAQSSLSNF